jgi:type IV secretion system protein VirB5
MKLIKKLFGTFALLSMGNAAHAGIPVIDAASLAQAMQQVAAWTKQFEQMKDQFTQLERQYGNLNGVRGMGSLANNPAMRQYLPANYQTILSNGYGNAAAIRSSSKVYGIESTSLDAGSDTAKAFEANANQAAINRAVSEDGYAQASARFAGIQTLLDKVNDAPDAKDIADLQARIQAEQVMQQNEQTKLMMFGQLAQAQRDLQAQKSREISMKNGRGVMPNGY